MQSAARAKFQVYLGNVSIFGPLSKNNTGMTALGADLPVIIQKFTVRPGGDGGTIPLSLNTPLCVSVNCVRTV